jgi:hypothetical protein
MPDQPDPADDPMFGPIVRGANAWHKHQQDIAHQSAGVDPDATTQD